MSQPVHISRVLSLILKKKGLAKGMEEYNALSQWHRIVGEQISRHTNPVLIKKGRAIIEVDDSVWINELSFLKNKIIEKFNTSIGKTIIKDISFRLK